MDLVKNNQESEMFEISEEEKLFRETVKGVLKMGVKSNNRLTPAQKQEAFDIIDKAAIGADWFVEIMRVCGYQ